MKYSYSKNIKTTFQEAEESIKNSLEKIGFGILTEINVDEAFESKLGINYRKYKILGACNPKLAHQALEETYNVGILMPCNVIIIDNEDGTIKVIFPKADSLLNITDNQEIIKLSKHVDELLESAFHNIH